MNTKSCAARRLLSAAALTIAVATGPAWAHEGHAPETPPPAAETQQVAPGVWVLLGSNGNVLIVPDDKGTLIVDDQRDTDHDEIVKAVGQVSKTPIRYVVNTHWHLDHAGGNAAFAKAGATIVAQRQVRERLAKDQYMAAYRVNIAASPVIAHPTEVFDDKHALTVGSETIQLQHTPNAHTDGDIIVRLPKANVLHMGDLFFGGMFPFIDVSTGGDIDGLVEAIDAALAMADDKTRIVPSHGPVSTKADLAAYRAMLVDVRDKVRTAKADGKTIMQTIEADLIAAYPIEGEGKGFVAAIYQTVDSTPAERDARKQAAPTKAATP